MAVPGVVVVKEVMVAVQVVRVVVVVLSLAMALVGMQEQTDL